MDVLFAPYAEFSAPVYQLAQAVAEGSNAALVELNFSRFDANDKEFLNQTTFYNLTRNNGYWQIMSIQSMGQLAGVKGK